MQDVFDTIVNNKVLLDPEFELLLCSLGLKVSLNSKGYPKTKLGLVSRMVISCAEGMEADHINGDPLDNRRVNLREVTHTQNMWNMKTSKTNKSGFRGISQDKISLLWVAVIWCSNKRYRKKFKGIEEAVAWRKEKEKTLYGVYLRPPP